ncbi:tRNA (adenosine(37)-N6)-threonylcarbamoyltransferase complex ATPase subunit type 1 TsaE [Aestuariivirga litoralis]|uniref:tRNA (adenosine(37)-N6)-threonylcarbamoyltransferase complex ATPase subunit type 1 TsaE n=1 Tax=Aestuariivirga litoralis TaxID=2650924 RepID=UPI0018C60376|nr:tRNA (adenosine(37)-N6)-threonylcarbamoyltransferase complex ATPase subunit type 1 TsaE [Aestuariivirga litoralis]MBG1233929.1 tRNA (adenosine(37)-N6)-threonylcarbamoyltransferase complex ATPase subunit type 1 TsaE [Aestuariivirga litoralis]
MIFASASPQDTENFARTLALYARPGMVLLLEGDLGAGKSTFARAFIRALAGGTEDFDIPSPTFSLVQIYDNTRVLVAHVDLYRLSADAEADELGLDELSASHLLLIEWPRAAQKSISPDTLHLQFSGSGETRTIKLTPQGLWQKILTRNAALERFLTSSGIDPQTRHFFEGDASARRYEKVKQGDETRLLMDMPPRVDGPNVKDGKPYAVIAHSAEGLHNVIAVNEQLSAMGYGAPKIFAHDLTHGFALVEDLGSRVYRDMMRSGENMDEPMNAAIAVLADIAQRPWPQTLPPYDIEAQLIEVDLLPVWFHKHVHKSEPPQALRDSFETIWRKLLPETQIANPVWVLRDYHSPNLIWLPERQGLSRVGLIDTQDALLGHPAYDLASLLQDARTDIDFDWADKLYAHYLSLRPGLDQDEFARGYAILGAQRASKILGIFARLNFRDGKPHYLQHMPRVSRYLARNLQHPVLHELKAWYETHMPEALHIGH